MIDICKQVDNNIWITRKQLLCLKLWGVHCNLPVKFLNALSLWNLHLNIHKYKDVFLLLLSVRSFRTTTFQILFSSFLFLLTSTFLPLCIFFYSLSFSAQLWRNNAYVTVRAFMHLSVAYIHVSAKEYGSVLILVASMYSCIFTQHLRNGVGCDIGSISKRSKNQSFSFPRPVTVPWLKCVVYPTIYPWLSWAENSWIHPFPRENTHSLVQYLNLGRWFYFLGR